MGRDRELPKHALTGIHVVVVDEDPDAAALLSTILTHCGALVSVTRGVDEAAATLARVIPDVVVASLSASPRGRPALIERIRVLRSAAGPATVAVLGHDDDPTTGERVLRAGFDAHVARPIDPWELCAVVAGVVRRAR